VVTGGQLVDVGLATVLLIVIPGPSVLFVVGRALAYGRRTALASVLGNSLGCVVAACVIALGLGEVLHRSDTVFEAIKYAGAAFLVVLGVRALRHHGNVATADVKGSPDPLRAAAAGFVVGLTNPKAFVIMAAIVPHFVDRSAGHVTAQMIILALVPLGIGLVTDSCWALAAGTTRDRLVARPRRLRLLGRVGGVCLVGVGAALAAPGAASP
jgi:threonine/homoserine/homoserine lactone efflux protein